jgi:hypothetical protein
MMESLYIELRQTYPGNKLHLMLVSPFIVETGTSLHYNVLKKRRLYTVVYSVHCNLPSVVNLDNVFSSSLLRVVHI